MVAEPPVSVSVPVDPPKSIKPPSMVRELAPPRAMSMVATFSMCVTKRLNGFRAWKSFLFAAESSGGVGGVRSQHRRPTSHTKSIEELTHVPQKRTSLISLYTNPVSISKVSLFKTAPCPLYPIPFISFKGRPWTARTSSRTGSAACERRRCPRSCPRTAPGGWEQGYLAPLDMVPAVPAVAFTHSR
jgi:hypothetical protein